MLVQAAISKPNMLLISLDQLQELQPQLATQQLPRNRRSVYQANHAFAVHLLVCLLAYSLFNLLFQ
jgi:hypothetical protein